MHRADVAQLDAFGQAFSDAATKLDPTGSSTPSEAGSSGLRRLAAELGGR